MKKSNKIIDILKRIIIYLLICFICCSLITIIFVGVLNYVENLHSVLGFTGFFTIISIPIIIFFDKKIGNELIIVLMILFLISFIITLGL